MSSYCCIHKHCCLESSWVFATAVAVKIELKCLAKFIILVYPIHVDQAFSHYYSELLCMHLFKSDSLCLIILI